MNRTWRKAPVTLILFAAAVGSAMGANLPKEGTYDLTSCYSGSELAVIPFSNTDTVRVREILGTTRNAIPGGFLDMSSYRCLVLATHTNGMESTTMICAATDADGDKLLTRQTGGGTQFQTVTLEGTGKFDGIERTGKMASLGTIPPAKAGTIQGCNRQTGTYKLKQ